MISISVCPNSISAQDNTGKFSGGPVLWNTEKISGNFGELRGSHLHSGIDYKTNEIEGLPVMAADDGYISRVKISSGGYGRALYINHAGNITTVYGHLRVFYRALEDSVHALKIKNQQSEIEFFPDSGAFRVKKGDIIALTGNTGGSQGPHLHFETRFLQSEIPFNPQILGYPVRDTVAPVIESFAIYEPGPGNGMFGSNRRIFNKKSQVSNYQLDTIEIGSNFFVGVESMDLAGQELNNLGVRSYELFVDDSLAFVCRIDSFSFAQTRMILACMDYGLYQETGRQIMVLIKLQGNQLPFYPKADGLVEFKDTKTHRIKIKVYDFNGNFNETVFVAMKNAVSNNISDPKGDLCKYDKKYRFKEKAYNIEVNPKTFFEDTWIETKMVSDEKQKFHSLSSIISIGPKNIPVNESISISLKISLPKDVDRSKLILVRLDEKGMREGISSTMSHKSVSFQTKVMGTFYLTIDTLPPVAGEPFWEPDSFTGQRKLIVPVTEDLSGLKGYSSTINNTWTACYYQAARKVIIIYPEDMPQLYQESNFEVMLSDKLENQKKYHFRLPR